jgi:hypothetical protein
MSWAAAFFAQTPVSLAGEMRSIPNGLKRKIQDIQKYTPARIDRAIDAVRVTSEANESFLQQPVAEPTRLLQAVFENAAEQDAVMDYPYSNRLSFCASEAGKLQKGKEGRRVEDEAWKFALPVWARFELTRPNWQCDRTCQLVMFSDLSV